MTEAASRIFGVRHLSPAASLDLLRFLEEVKPKRILVEGPQDADELINFLVSPKSKPPLAILAYTTQRPVRSILYPFAEYSPEYVAMKWAVKNKVPVSFMDLPTSVFLAMEKKDSEEAQTSISEGPAQESLDPYEEIAKREGFDDYDTWWEYRFEHNRNPGAFHQACAALGEGLREFQPLLERDRLRERRMRFHIAQAQKELKNPLDLAVVCGAYHSSALEDLSDQMDDEQLAALDTCESRLSLMPYSYGRLASRSGYGAGNRAPAYYGVLWNQGLAGEPEQSTDVFMTRLSILMREEGNHRSTAEIIDAVRLAETLAALRSGPAPSLMDLRDAAMGTLGRGDLVSLASALAETEIGTVVGKLTEGSGRTSVQEDFYREMEDLKLSKFTQPISQELSLDLRENRRSATEDSALLDLRRSRFLWRLEVLDVGFGERKPRRQDSGTWAEDWNLKWTPESEIVLAESSLYGDTVETASAYLIQEKLEDSKTVDEAAQIAARACACGLESSLRLAFARLESSSIDAADFATLGRAAWSTGLLMVDGGLRRVDVSAAAPLLQKLFLGATLRLIDAASCDPTAARELVGLVNLLDKIALDQWETVDGELWKKTLDNLARRDDRSPLLSGYAAAILLERNLLSTGDLAVEMSRRLSPGMSVDLGAHWFEGLTLRNRLGLLSRLELWKQLSAYVDGLDDGEFTRAAVLLRRAFGEFSPQERRMICENLGEIWQVTGDQVEHAVRVELKEEDKKKLASVNDFDFDDV